MRAAISLALIVLGSFAHADILVSLQSNQDAQYRKVMALAQSEITSRIYEISYYRFRKISSYAEFCIQSVGDESELAQHLKDLMGDDKTVHIGIEPCAE